MLTSIKKLYNRFLPTQATAFDNSTNANDEKPDSPDDKPPFDEQFLEDFESLLLKRQQEIREHDFYLNMQYPLLERKHVKNIKHVVDRIELLEIFPPNGTAAEIGVDKGEYSEEILRIASPKKLHLIDSWSSDRYNDSLFEAVTNKYADLIAENIVEVNRGLSVDVLETFDDSYFDWVYIDTDHSFSNTLQELELCSKKVKPEGIIAGHDFFIGNWITGYKYGTMEAVYKFCHEFEWEIIYLTTEIVYNSYALRRLS